MTRRQILLATTGLVSVKVVKQPKPKVVPPFASPEKMIEWGVSKSIIPWWRNG